MMLFESAGKEEAYAKLLHVRDYKERYIILTLLNKLSKHWSGKGIYEFHGNKKPPSYTIEWRSSNSISKDRIIIFFIIHMGCSSAICYKYFDYKTDFKTKYFNFQNVDKISIEDLCQDI